MLLTPETLKPWISYLKAKLKTPTLFDDYPYTKYDS
jgi:hypothetical protein